MGQVERPRCNSSSKNRSLHSFCPDISRLSPKSFRVCITNGEAIEGLPRVTVEKLILKASLKCIEARGSWRSLFRARLHTQEPNTWRETHGARRVYPQPSKNWLRSHIEKATTCEMTHVMLRGALHDFPFLQSLRTLPGPAGAMVRNNFFRVTAGTGVAGKHPETMRNS